MGIVTINRTRQPHPFSRVDLVRMALAGTGGRACDWCGNVRGKRRNLFSYATVSDDRPGSFNWLKGMFCCKGCAEAYHNGPLI